MTDMATPIDSFIVFTVAQTAYALRSRDVQHMEMVEGMTRVPNAAPFVDGVVFSRGQVVPAVNLRARFGFERAPYDLRTRLIVVRAADRTVG
ncbi:MAG TPA: chemotaxis protein CheW, partial [Vicinamibacterales bacterium]|nr:chemotaxis protein CheW [Vicinamibacterales bacterium]